VFFKVEPDLINRYSIKMSRYKTPFHQRWVIRRTGDDGIFARGRTSKKPWQDYPLTGKYVFSSMKRASQH
jgi:hypothetical protein